MKVTIHQVASRAKVSVSTVSRALRDHPRISPECVARVKNAAESLQYRPLRRRRSTQPGRPLADTTIGLVLLGMDRSLSSVPVVAEAIHGVESALARAGAWTLLADVPDLTHVPVLLGNRRLEGLLLKGANQGDLSRQIGEVVLERFRELPCVWFMGRPKGCLGDMVSSDDITIGRMAAEFLLSKGHRHLAIINAKPDHVIWMRREDGFLAAARRVGVEPQVFADLVALNATAPLRPVTEVAAVQKLIDEMLAVTPRPTAVFTLVDSVAMLVYRALAVRGLRVGKDISVISANYEPAFINGLYPALTTIDVRACEIGRRAVDQLAWRMTHREAPTAEVLIEPTFVSGESVVEFRRSAKQ